MRRADSGQMYLNEFNSGIPLTLRGGPTATHAPLFPRIPVGVVSRDFPAHGPQPGWCIHMNGARTPGQGG